MRFQALEQFLPQKYQEEELLEYQRRIHSVLIERGLEMISFEYMKEIKEKCQNCQIIFEEKLEDGKNSDVIITHTALCDLIIMGAQGMGSVPEFSHLGSNTRRVLHHTSSDILIVREKTDFKKILVGIDGSDSAFQALQRGIDLAKQFDSDLLILSSFDPGLHPVVFKYLSSVLSDEAGRVFKFNEQAQLHTSVIDTSLEDLYKDHLIKAQSYAAQQGVVPQIDLLHGKPFASLLKKSRDTNADLLIVGRYGMHQGQKELIGSNAERLAELASTNVLVTSSNMIKPFVAENSDLLPVKNKYDKKLTWSNDAQKRLENIPGFARPMAILAIERYAREHEITIITPEIMRDARGHYE
jgi:nucleotide-binding universal stress UspA family protein